VLSCITNNDTNINVKHMNTEVKFCPKCGHVYHSGISVCPKCGHVSKLGLVGDALRGLAKIIGKK
jgi:uncharacterized OB-fold protein